MKVDSGAPGAFQSSAVPNLIPPGRPATTRSAASCHPGYQYASVSAHQDNPYGTGDGRTDGEIPPVPTTQTPKPFAADHLGVIVVTPDPALFPPPWPAAIYGPGFTRSDYDLFVTADYNASEGIVTLATDPSGHGFGPLSTTTVTSNGSPTTFLSYGRGRDLDGDGRIGNGLNDGVGPTGHFQPDGSELPTRKPIDGLESGLVQTTVDNMALGRALTAGLDIPGVGSNLVNPSRIMYYGLSFGGIYGTMLRGTDPLFHQGLLNVAGGPIVDIARLSSFRGDLAAQLGRLRPSYLNGGPGLNGFIEDLPLRNDPSQVITHPGAAALQELFGSTNWYDRTGSPETFAPRMRLRPDPAWAAYPKNFVFQTAYANTAPRRTQPPPPSIAPGRCSTALCSIATTRRRRTRRIRMDGSPARRWREYIGRAAARRLPAHRADRQHQPSVARGSDRQPQQPRVPALRGSADRPAPGPAALPRERRLSAARLGLNRLSTLSPPPPWATRPGRNRAAPGAAPHP